MSENALEVLDGAPTLHPSAGADGPGGSTGSALEEDGLAGGLASGTPRAAVRQVLGQASPSRVLPSSQVSPACTIPSPQRGNVHVFEQPSVAILFPSSHCSSACTIPSPQRSLQVLEHASLSTEFPSSHVSGRSTKPSPQRGTGAG